MFRTTCLLTVSLLMNTGAADETKRPERKPVVPSERASAIHREAILVDGHNDLPWQYRRKKDPSFVILDITKPQKDLHTDIPRLRKGGVGAQFWSAYVPAETRASKTAVRETLEQIDIIHRMVRTYPKDFEMALTVDDIRRIRKQGRIASLIGVEGGHSIADSLGVLRMYHALGVRYMTITHSETLDWADSATDKPKSNGLSPFGEEVVREMNALGLLVDLSHVSADTMKHALRITKAPVIFSHSSAFAIAPHPRNVPDDVLKLVKANGGVVMVNFYSGFIMPEGAQRMMKMFEMERELRKRYPGDREYREAMRQWLKENPVPAGTVHDVADHVEHIVKVAGIDHVGLGSDFDGINKCPVQLEDVSCYPNLTQVLLDRGWSEKSIRKLLGENVLRVMGEVEKAAARK